MVDRNTGKQELLPWRQAEWDAAGGPRLFLVLFHSEIVLMWQKEFVCWFVCLLACLKVPFVFGSLGCCLSSGGTKDWPSVPDVWEIPRPFYMSVK